MVYRFSELEERRRYKLLLVISVISSVFIVSFCLNSWLSQRHLESLILLGFAIFTLGNLALMKVTHNYERSALLMSSVAVILTWYLVAFGGYENTGYLWVYPIAPIIVSLCGFTTGAVLLSIMFSGISVILLVPGMPDFFAVYNVETVSRFLLTMLALILLTLASEFSRTFISNRMQTFNDDIEKVANHDQLTGLHSRYFVQNYIMDGDVLRQSLADSSALLLLDIDHFKEINDNYGHNCGDYVLKCVADCIKSHTRQDDYVARWGGEEFLVVLPFTDMDAAKQRAETMRRAVEDLRFNYEGNNLQLTISVGASLSRPEVPSYVLLKEVDQQLYQAKNSGRNRVCSCE